MKHLLCLVLLLAAAGRAPAGCYLTLTNPPPKTVACNSAWSFDPPTVTTHAIDGADCCGYTLSALTPVTNGTCPKVISETWQLVDACGATQLCTQVVTVVNTNKPNFGVVNNLLYYSCSNTHLYYNLAPTSPCCTDPVTMTFSPPSGVILGPGQTTNVICVATDCCGNTNVASFLVSVQLPPLELYCAPKTVTNGAAWTFDTPYLQLGCCSNSAYTLTNLTPVTNAGCPQTISQTWVFTDACGHTTNATQLVTVLGPPVFPPATGDYLANGSFEQPALAGNGDSASTDPGFALPGWTYPTGAGQFFLEHGAPAGFPRYQDGRQAVCLNGQGTPVSLSQTFPTIPGQNYSLSFWQSDASNAVSSLSELTVSVAGLSRVYSRSNDTVYAFHRWQFTANDYCTTLQFTDTTPPGNPSPFLDAVCVNPGGFPVAGNFTLIPNGHGGWEQFPTGPSLSQLAAGPNVAFAAYGSGGQAGIYSVLPNGVVQDVADLFTPIPPGPGKFASFSGTSGRAGVPSTSMGLVAFWGADASWNEGIYVGDGVHPLQALADTTTANPSGGGNFMAFTGNLAYPGNPLIRGHTIAFFGAGPGMMQGIYAGFPSDPIRVVADLHTNLPAGSGKITTFTTSSGVPPSLGLDGHNVALWAGGMSSQQGIYVFPGSPVYPSSPIKVADLNTPMPGAPGNFTDFIGDPTAPVGPVLSGGNVAFRGYGAGGRIGVYAMIGGMLARVVDNTIPMTGGMGMFMDLQAVSLSGDVVAFLATGPGGQMGIYVSFPSSPIKGFPSNPLKVIDLNDTLDGKTITGLLLGPGGLSGDPLAFAATFSDGSQGIYTIPVVVETEITSAARAGNDLQLTYTAPAGYNYSVLSRTNLTTGAWATLPGTNVGNGSLLQTTVTNPFAASRQFYRVQQSH